MFGCEGLHYTASVGNLTLIHPVHSYRYTEFGKKLLDILIDAMFTPPIPRQRSNGMFGVNMAYSLQNWVHQ
jgi:hypothetical protein